MPKLKKKKKNIKNELFKNFFTNYRSPSDIYKMLRETEGKKKKNKDEVYAMKKVLNKMKKLIEHVPEDEKSMVEENER